MAHISFDTVEVLEMSFFFSFHNKNIDVTIIVFPRGPVSVTDQWFFSPSGELKHCSHDQPVKDIDVFIYWPLDADGLRKPKVIWRLFCRRFWASSTPAHLYVHYPAVKKTTYCHFKSDVVSYSSGSECLCWMLTNEPFISTAWKT